ncbi:HPr family phosphocarrier protein [Mediterraneibacter agrestimuris]|uniref:HPr family phosphocarrier protein n=1 Tax=Mediterraneibacter agrestimuris TaxID=2941333 RepID=UPI00203AEDC9|nr:HPr family phosphocarrier protein [Mediterraneibacter agrestimuris]
MAKFNYVITDEVGLHARPAGLLAKQAKATGAKITLNCNGKSADASKLMAVMGMGVKKGMEVEVTVEGDNADAVAAEMETFFKENL